MNLDERLKKEYGGSRAALLYCTSMNMNITQTAAFLGTDRKVIKRRAKVYGITFPDGYATRDMAFIVETNRSRLQQLNALGLMGKNRKRLAVGERKPITHNGITWFPGEPMHHYLFEKCKEII